MNTDESELALFRAERRVREIQAKLHRWARDDPHRRFDDLFNLVADPAFLLVAWDRVRSNKGARTAGVDGSTAASIAAGKGVEVFLDELRSHLRDRSFGPLPVKPNRGLPDPIVRLLYQRGEFTPDQTPVVAGALAAFTVGLVFNGWMLLLNRAFYGLRLNWIPTLVALGNLILNVILFAALYPVGVWGLPLATSLSNLAGAVALAVLMWRRVGAVDTGATMLALGRIVVAAVLASGLAVLVWWGVDAVAGRSTLGQVVSVGAGLGIGTVAYVGACRVLGVRELGSLFELRRRG